MRKIPFAGVELTSQRVRGLRGTSELPGRPTKIFVKYFININININFSNNININISISINTNININIKILILVLVLIPILI